MPDATTKSRPATSAAASSQRLPGTARTAHDRASAAVAVAAPSPVLTPENFRTIGSTLNGDHWQADIAKQIGCSKSQITRYLNKSRDLNSLSSRHLQFVIIERISQLTKLLDLPGMPYAGSQEVKEAARTISTALAPLPGQEPPRER